MRFKQIRITLDKRRHKDVIDWWEKWPSEQEAREMFIAYMRLGMMQATLPRGLVDPSGLIPAKGKKRSKSNDYHLRLNLSPTDHEDIIQAWRSARSGAKASRLVTLFRVGIGCNEDLPMRLLTTVIPLQNIMIGERVIAPNVSSDSSAQDTLESLMSGLESIAQNMAPQDEA